jgi:hypothetical protein
MQMRNREVYCSYNPPMPLRLSFCREEGEKIDRSDPNATPDPATRAKYVAAINANNVKLERFNKNISSFSDFFNCISNNSNIPAGGSGVPTPPPTPTPTTLHIYLGNTAVDGTSQTFGIGQPTTLVASTSGSSSPESSCTWSFTAGAPVNLVVSYNCSPPTRSRSSFYRSPSQVPRSNCRSASVRVVYISPTVSAPDGVNFQIHMGGTFPATAAGAGINWSYTAAGIPANGSGSIQLTQIITALNSAILTSGAPDSINSYASCLDSASPYGPSVVSSATWLDDDSPHLSLFGVGSALNSEPGIIVVADRDAGCGRVTRPIPLPMSNPIEVTIATQVL